MLYLFHQTEVIMKLRLLMKFVIDDGELATYSLSQRGCDLASNVI
jgi:hypothetical protein